jgi:type VI secretion system ImpA family protein
MSQFPYPLERLLRPISAEAPAGEFLRYEGVYDRIREAARFDDPTLTQGVWKTAIKKAEWREVERLCLEAIETRSKDLQIAAWLTEAWVNLHRFAGLREGLRLMTSLTGEFWDAAYPPIEDGDLEYRFSPFVWLNGKLPTALKLLPLTAPAGEEDAVAYSWADRETAYRPQSANRDKDAAAVTRESLERSVSLTPDAHFERLAEDVRSAQRACRDLNAILDARGGASAPSLSQLSGLLDEIALYLRTLLVERGVDDAGKEAAKPLISEPPPDSPAGNVMLAPPEMTEPARNPGTIRTRDDAYRQLAEAADFLARIEPHSPTPYLVRRAVAWGNKKFEDLIPELVQNNQELEEIFQLLRIEKDSRE